MNRYFINKDNQEIAMLTREDLINECLTATRQVGTEMVEIDGQMVEQPKLEKVWEEITEQEYKAKTEPSQEELDRQAIQEKIAELKSNLSQTDYQAIKFAEGQMTESEYIPIKVQRQAWRNEINELEQQIALDKN